MDCAPAATAAGASPSRSSARSSSSRRRLRDHARPRLAGGAQPVLQLAGVQVVDARDRAGVPAQRQDLLDRRGVHPHLRARARRAAQPAGPGLLPAAALAIVYADLFRGIPTILVIAMLGFGAPALGLSYVPTSIVFWGIVALVLIYSAYVSEVYRAGIESIHPSQEAAARSLGLSRWPDPAARDPAAGGAPRHPAAAERLHRPAEGHGARRHARRGRGVPAVADRRERDLQLHRVPLRRGALRRDHDPAGAVHRLADPARPPASPGRWGDRCERRTRRRGALEVVRQAPGPPRDRPDRRRARGGGADRRVRVGQVDAAPLHQPARADRRRPHLPRRRGDHAAAAT